VHINKSLACFRQQLVSIAGKNDHSWRQKVDDEIDYEIKKSIEYFRKEKKMGSIKINALKIYSKTKRIFLKTIFFHYQLRFIEKLFYRLKK